MTNGSNSWGVSYSHITWLERFLHQHKNVKSFTRERDIVFIVSRHNQDDIITILCLNEYIMSSTKFRAALEEFPDVNMIYIGGGWNGYTKESLEISKEAEIGMYVTDDLSGAIWKHEHWNYFRRDEKGNPLYRYSRGSG